MANGYLTPKSSLWRDVPKEDWLDWRWQLRNRITTLEQLESICELHPDEITGLKVSRGKLATSITPYWAELMDKDDPRCPIRRQIVPHIAESDTDKHEYVDPCGEDTDSPVAGLVHRYPDRVLFLVTDKCASYCRFCTRKRIVSDEERINIEERVEKAVQYIKKNKQIRDVLISGGDPLILSDTKLDYILSSFRKLTQIEILRIGTRVPLTLPYRVTPKLLDIFAKYHPFWLSLHINHPDELTAEVRDVCNQIADKGIPMGSQTVLLSGINDNAIVMKRLIQQLLTIRVRPYYLYQCDPVLGTGHFRTTIAKGLEIIESLRGFTSGYALPTYVVDAPGGGGKVPISPNYIVKYDKGKLVLRNYAGKKYEYYEVPVKSTSKRSATASPGDGSRKKEVPSFA